MKKKDELPPEVKEKIKKLDKSIERARAELMKSLDDYMKEKHGVEQVLGETKEGRKSSILKSLKQLLTDEEIRKSSDGE